ncbi:energy transducer TonB [Pseudobacter ginsenosidimutans]|uniref:Outer membrane transport energization protein TonB n=1 Tax=Pseudobacter ginsenosidimutans TaxID=661488 RepID=A0A4Q7MZA1_9BACT|nr:energy transducer TonB [Pseudobacter ginsenosidimutans]QEC40718.1 energy transducer TonB [Pseudobacter ginsenosidimutans]RZS72563.1 outer membrane transport energization protein TonB [Pseudobacter ginsenosidimutans]
MEISNILTADVLDIIFDGKNKSYGAYELRKSYKRRMLLSLAGMLTIILFFIGTMLLANSKKERQATLMNVQDIELEKVNTEKEEVKPPPPPKPPEPPKQIATRIYTAPVISNEVRPEERPPENAELEEVKIGTQNIDGNPDDGTLAPPSMKGEGVSTGVIEEVVKKESDEPFMKVEIESSYPGGSEAWRRFLIKQLQRNYPQDAIDNGIQGTVIIQFIVDAEGNVSNVEALSGPEELRDAAIRVIQKSGKWIPAVQNKRHVKSYKKQPIGFLLANE